MKRIASSPRGVKRIVLAWLVLLAVGSGAAAAVAAPRSGREPPRARLTGFVCDRALEPGTGAVSLTARMRPLPGTEELSLRFDLLTSVHGGPFSEVHAPGLGTWIGPANRTLGQRPGDVWVFDKHVLALSSPGVYRFHVTFRWIGAHGEVLGRIERVSPLCRQSRRGPGAGRVTQVTFVGPPSADRAGRATLMRR
ncbi:MAG: hypothetical protein ACR2LV_00640 [Solirubrobacteraceae bacterium]